MAKVTIIGAGQTGATTAHWLAKREIADIVMIDIIDGVAQGKALDLMEALPIIGSDVSIVGSNGYDESADSDVVVITAGLPRKPGMSRDDLLAANRKIVASAVERSIRVSPNAVYIVLTNPVDAMSYLAMKKSGLSRERVIGQGGVLDSARMRTFVAMELNVSVQNVHCYVLGGHGDDMLPLTRHSNVAGVSLGKIIRPKRLKAIIKRTRKGGEEIVSLLKSGSAFYAPSAALAQMVEAILLDRKQIVLASAYLDGEYGLTDIYFGVPVKLGRGGMEQIIEYDLNKSELSALEASVSRVRKTIEALALG